MLYAKVDRCPDGRLRGRDVPSDLYGDRFFVLRTHRCDSCDVLVLPAAVKWLDWRWWTTTRRFRTVLRRLKQIGLA